MKFIKTPVRGMPEQLPADMNLRERVLNEIKNTYCQYGFSLIETPAIEHIENLTNKQGGENEQLIFKIMKRGDKLKNANSFDDICDCGLRYDLTVPLARFYANNNNCLTMPFKALQIGPAWRADSPQKGRYRQFTQCDIDILGDSSNLAEIELIAATTDMLAKLGLGNSKVRINDRQILRAMALFCGFPEEKLSTIFIILDKYDKIGVEGVRKSLYELGLSSEGINKYCEFFDNGVDFLSCSDYFSDKRNTVVSPSIIANLEEIIRCSNKLIKDKGRVVFDPTLVRGMSYYTGPIFEIELQSYKLSIAGGGRYDEMIGKYSGLSTPACGFSIGFERIIEIIKSQSSCNFFEFNDGIAFLISRDVSIEKKQTVLIRAMSLRSAGKQVMVSMRNKNVKAQKDKLALFGYNSFVDVFEDTVID